MGGQMMKMRGSNPLFFLINLFIMNKETFVTKAAAQQLNLSNININMLKPEHMELILGGQCICCAGDVAIDVDDEGAEGIVSYTQELFCQGCEDHIPAATLLAYGVISQQEYDTLCNPFADYDEENDLKRQWLSTYPDASTGYDEWLYARMCMSQGKDQQPSAGGQFDCGDDELPF